MKEYELYIPLTYNDGSPVEPRKIERIGELLLKRFDGVTFFPQSNEGRWKMGSVVYHDQIVIFRVITGKVNSTRRFFKRLKEELKLDLNQQDILIVEKDAKVLVFTESRDTLEWLQQRLREGGLEALAYHGDLPLIERDRQVARGRFAMERHPTITSVTSSQPSMPKHSSAALWPGLRR